MPTKLEPQKERRGHPRYYELLDEMAAIHDAKNADYAGDDSPLRNLRECAEAGVEPWVGVITRMTDKWSRLKTFSKKREFAVKEEGLRDTLLDNANYSLLCLILFEEEYAKEEPTHEACAQPDIYKTAASAIPAYPWRAIETAPKHADALVLYVPFLGAFIGYFLESQRRWVVKGLSELYYPTHWLPLPEAPR